MTASTVSSDMVPPRDPQELERRVRELRADGMHKAAEALIEAYRAWYGRR